MFNLILNWYHTASVTLFPYSTMLLFAPLVQSQTPEPVYADED